MLSVPYTELFILHVRCVNGIHSFPFFFLKGQCNFSSNWDCLLLVWLLSHQFYLGIIFPSASN
jgi:hypothetical protein